MSEDRTKPYRCLIPPDDCACRIRIGGRDVVCDMLDLSRADFRVRLPKGVVRKLQKARHIELRYHGERWSVCINQTEPQQPDVVMLDRIDELTRVKPPSPWNTLLSLRMSRETDPRFVLGLLLAFIAVCVCLPGIGDRLGTAPKVKTGVQSLLRAFW